MNIDNLFPQGQVIYGPVGQVLSYVVTSGPDAPHWLRSDRSGNLLVYSSGGFETLPPSTVLNVIAPRTDTVTFVSADMVMPSFTSAVFSVRVTAVSGTTPSMTVAIQSKDSQGGYSGSIGGGSMTALTTVGTAVSVVSIVNNNSFNQVSTTFRIQATITGTTPSFTWFMDMIYK